MSKEKSAQATQVIDVAYMMLQPLLNGEEDMCDVLMKLEIAATIVFSIAVHPDDEESIMQMFVDRLRERVRDFRATFALEGDYGKEAS